MSIHKLFIQFPDVERKRFQFITFQKDIWFLWYVPGYEKSEISILWCFLWNCWNQRVNVKEEFWLFFKKLHFKINSILFIWTISLKSRDIFDLGLCLGLLISVEFSSISSKWEILFDLLLIFSNKSIVLSEEQPLEHWLIPFTIQQLVDTLSPLLSVSTSDERL